MRNLLLSSFIILFSLSANAQFAPDFTVTDTNGEEHNLYSDYLDQGKTVVIKFFFVGCPPCTAIAPDVQALYESFGAGNNDVEFFEFSTQSSNTDAAINNYLGGLNVTIPASGQGGGFEAGDPYRSGDFGTFFGTPAFAVIAPDRNVVYFRSTGNLTQVTDAILETGAMMVEEEEEEEEEVEPTVFNFEFTDALGDPVDNVVVTLEDASASNNTSYVINTNSLNEVEITNFEEEFPGITTPVFRFENTGPANEGLSIIDLLTIQRHILDLEPFTDPDLIDAADVNTNGSISVTDIITIQRLILNLTDEFPGGVDPWIIKQNNIPLTLSPGNTIDIEVEMVKRGDVR